MGQPLLKIKKGKIIGLVLFLVIAIGIYLFITIETDKMIDRQAAEIRQTENLPEKIKQFLSRPTFNDNDRAFTDMVEKQVEDTTKYFFAKYLCFTDEIMGGSMTNTKFDAIYDQKINSLLGTDSNLKSNSLDGIILRKTNLMQVGVYSSKDGKGDSVPAEKLFYTLTYIKLPQEIIVHRDTIWGKDPDKEIKISSGHRTGEPPADEEIVAAIKKSLNQ